ncbi:YbaK/EbsC family protein [Kaistia dalseonensis]|uniref:Prolyl-tRNA editing enzyme YbaK/EbsC (Cys-tRNA(Pro) deacylase) n=1 Tax=Kaistia dalseonensis TaxID=410840 RepID=A0ABU0H688_9HYPH|nr:YbaK/EbsC family protein [Kaistia dalseonensis]MCX5495220.1 YbaK/EbsC family protein [Kaistia dalseonensis]MDQ0437806.1 prolyl-tRNA editing enzyme YbaK/EbsC (Cys-tRNA(Pro) deacylase) [Kaistia dalseonensis]
MNELTGSARRVLDAAETFGLSVTVRTMPESTRTAEEAAAACGCSVGEIVKSLVFRGTQTGRPLLLLVSGANRVDEAKVAAAIGEPIERPNAAFVRAATGFAIGGIPPFAHATPLATWLDVDLLAFETVWAAAGTPHAVFSVSPSALRAALAAPVMAML